MVSRHRRTGSPIPSRSRPGILAKGRAISREVVINYAYGRRTASKGHRIVRDEVYQHQARRVVQYIYQPWDGSICHSISQKLPSDREGEDHPQIFAKGGWGVVGKVFVVDITILAGHIVRG